MTTQQNRKINKKSNKFALFIAVGMRFLNNHIFTNDDNITLELEPTNLFDKDAVKILVNGIHEGYVSKNNNIIIGKIFQNSDYSIKVNNVFEQSAELIIYF